MIKIEELVPEVYTKESRDFQLISKVFDILFNYIKTAADSMLFSEKEFIDLQLITLGFDLKGNYRKEILQKLAEVFPSMIKNKGNLTAIEQLVNAVSQEMSEVVDYEILAQPSDLTENVQAPSVVQIYSRFGANDSTTMLIREVLDYIMPVNSIYTIQKAIKADTPDCDIESEDKGYVVKVEDAHYNISKNTETYITEGENVKTKIMEGSINIGKVYVAPEDKNPTSSES